MADLIEKGVRVQWPKRGAGTGLRGEGKVIMLVDPPKTNKEAFEELRELRDDLVLRKTYFKGAWETHSTYRAFVACERPGTTSHRPIYDIYAPNRADLRLV